MKTIILFITFFVVVGLVNILAGQVKNLTTGPIRPVEEKKNVAFSPGRTGTESIFCSVEL